MDVVRSVLARIAAPAGGALVARRAVGEHHRIADLQPLHALAHLLDLEPHRVLIAIDPQLLHVETGVRELLPGLCLGLREHRRDR